MIGELILQPILEFIFYFVGYYVGRVIVPILSLGRIKCDRLLADKSRKLRWGISFYRRGRQICLTAEATATVGVLFVGLVVAGGILVYNLRG